MTKAAKPEKAAVSAGGQGAPICFRPTGNELALLDALVAELEKETGLDVGRSGAIRMAIHQMARKRKIKKQA